MIVRFKRIKKKQEEIELWRKEADSRAEACPAIWRI